MKNLTLLSIGLLTSSLIFSQTDKSSEKKCERLYKLINQTFVSEYALEVRPKETLQKNREKLTLLGREFQQCKHYNTADFRNKINKNLNEIDERLEELSLEEEVMSKK